VTAVAISGKVARSSDPGYDGGAPVVSIPGRFDSSIDLVFLAYERSIGAVAYDEDGRGCAAEEENYFLEGWSRSEVLAIAEALAVKCGAVDLDGVAACVDQLAVWHGWYEGDDLADALVAVAAAETDERSFAARSS
jgi:hypothetical protein